LCPAGFVAWVLGLYAWSMQAGQPSLALAILARPDFGRASQTPSFERTSRTR
jgi:hypothetical protein